MQYAADWPVPQGDLAANRNAQNASINADNLSQLDVAWTFDLTAAGFFGSVTANPIVVGETVYIQDMQSNIFALNRADDLPQYQGATGPDPDRSANFADATGGLVAINAADGSVKWEAKLPTLVVGGATVANNVVFTAGLDGFFRGFDVETGQELWSYESELGINAPPAIAGDTIFVAAGFVKLPQVGSTATPAAETGESPVAKLIALRLGGAGAATPAPEPTIGPTEATVTPEATEPAAESPVAGGEAGASVAMVDINFDPKEITIPANTDVVIDLVNNGSALHNFTIDELDVHSGDYQPGQTGTVTINAAPGDYQYYCSIPGHKEAGMVGTLHVQ